VIAAIAIGSNLGDRASHLEFARDRLSSLLTGFRFSSIHETDPEGVPGVQPRFLNAAAVGETSLDGKALLASLLDLEAERGRARPFPNAPRSLDLDLILLGSQILDEPALTLPHPRFRERLFVLEPLAEVAPDLIDPVTGNTVSELLHRARAAVKRGRTPFSS
jgi:2-amino-4-hydroxy-6-hydroxymethyldihydropteridine diphosphokinase